MAEELMVVLKRSENSGFGFSLLGTTGPPHVIYDIVENSPAAECGEVEAGDIIVKVNGIDVHRYTTKEVLKCLRLSDDLVTLELKRDPKIKAHIKEHLAKTSNLHNLDVETNKNNIYDIKSRNKNTDTTLSSATTNQFIANSATTTIATSTTTSASINKSQSSQHQHQHHSHNQQHHQHHHHNRINSEPTYRPSRIPQAVRSPPPKSVPQSPYNKKSKPSNLPTINTTTAGSNTATTAAATAAVATSNINNGSGNNFVNYQNQNSSQQQVQQQQHTSQPPSSYYYQQQQQQQHQHQHQHHHNQHHHQPTSAPPVGKARFEAFMMTGDLILNLSRTPQSSNLIASHAKKVDSLRDSPQRSLQQQHSNGALAPRASGESTPSSSSSPTQSQSSDSNNSIKNKNKNLEKHHNSLLNDKQRLRKELTTDEEIEAEEEEEEELEQEQEDGEGVEEEYEEDDDDEDEDEEEEINEEERTKLSTETILNVKSCSNRDRKNKNSEKYQKLKSGRVGGGGDALYGSTAVSNDLSACVSSSSSSLNKKEIKDSNLYNLADIDSGSSTVVGFSKDLCSSTASSHNNQQTISSSSSSTVKSEAISSPETSFSVPTSPISLSTPLIEKDTANSVPTSPEQSIPEVVRRQHNGIVRKCDAAGFRTSKSEDHLQQTQRDGIGAVIPIDIDEDVNSSLNTLLDTRQDSDDSQSMNRDRIVWTYNAPVSAAQSQQNTATVGSNSHSSSISSSPQRSDSPASPTSVSSSVMSSNSGSKGATGNGFNPVNHGGGFLTCPINGDQSVSEAVSNISSPDYQDDDNLLSSKDLAAMALSDPSDSDSTILVSEAAAQRKRSEHALDRDNKIVIQVKGGNYCNSDRDQNQLKNSQGYSELQNSEDELATLTEEPPTVLIGGGNGQDTKESSPPVSDDGSDAESLHSYHYSPKAVDMPSAIRLAKRLYSLDGFKKSDVSRHLSKNNDFSRAVADEYLKYFNFENQTLDQSLRDFLQQFSLSGETQERERVLVHFSKRYLDCNPGTFNSQDAVHTLTCAIMLLNTDLHGPNTGRKMTCAEFVDNLAELNDGENFPKDVLKYLYQAIKNHPLEWALDDDVQDQQQQQQQQSKKRTEDNMPIKSFRYTYLEIPQDSAAIEYKKGYVMRKCCYDSNYKKTPFGKRSWKMFYCTLRDLVLYLHKDEHGFRKNQMSDNIHNAIRIHHALATKATDYTKKQHVFRLQTADQSEFLFQTSDSKELQSWIDTINFVCASLSAPPLEAGVGSQKRFQRPLLPITHTKLLLKEQLASHEQQVNQLENALAEHKRGPIPSKGLPLQNYKEKEAYLQYELKRYNTYINILNTRMVADEQSYELNLDDIYPPDQRTYGSVIGNNSISPPIPAVGGNLLQQQQPQQQGQQPQLSLQQPQQQLGQQQPPQQQQTNS